MALVIADKPGVAVVVTGAGLAAPDARDIGHYPAGAATDHTGKHPLHAAQYRLVEHLFATALPARLEGLPFSGDQPVDQDRWPVPSIAGKDGVGGGHFQQADVGRAEGQGEIGGQGAAETGPPGQLVHLAVADLLEQTDGRPIQRVGQGLGKGGRTVVAVAIVFRPPDLAAPTGDGDRAVVDGRLRLPANLQSGGVDKGFEGGAGRPARLGGPVEGGFGKRGAAAHRPNPGAGRFDAYQGRLRRRLYPAAHALPAKAGLDAPADGRPRLLLGQRVEMAVDARPGALQRPVEHRPGLSFHRRQIVAVVVHRGRPPAVQADLFSKGPLGRLGGDVAIGGHPVEDVLLPLHRPVEVGEEGVAARCLGQAGEEGRFGQGETGGALAEIDLGRRLHPICSLAEIDLVEVDVEDLLLAEQAVDPVGEDRLLEFAQIALLRREEEGFGHLLGDGRPPLAFRPVAEIVHCRPQHREEVEARVLEEAAILGGDKGLGQMCRHPLERYHPAVLLKDPFHHLAMAVIDIARLGRLVAGDTAQIGNAQAEIKGEQSAEKGGLQQADEDEKEGDMPLAVDPAADPDRAGCCWFRGWHCANTRGKIGTLSGSRCDRVSCRTVPSDRHHATGKTEAMTKIRILPEQLANQIAAGEVVERPASVVKELLENSLDAGADRIEIDIEGGGTRLIRVIDNGCGMDEDDLLLSLERHGTSKIHLQEDLQAIATLGFRGEALPSIGSVAELLISSRPAAAPLGTRVELRYGRLVKVHETGCPVGTTVEVRRLFANTPARRKFLRTARTELGHIEEVVKNAALATPEIAFLLRLDGRELFNLTATSLLGERLAAVLRYPGEFIEVGVKEGRRLPRVYGLLLPPEEPRAGPAGLRLLVNGRTVRDRMLSHAVMEGMRSFLLKGRGPAGLIHLHLPPAEVDVNVHPAKHEVRFRQARDMHSLLSGAVAQAMVAYQSRVRARIFGPDRRNPATPIPAEQSYPLADQPRGVELADAEPTRPYQGAEIPTPPPPARPRPLPLAALPIRATAGKEEGGGGTGTAASTGTETATGNPAGDTGATAMAAAGMTTSLGAATLGTAVPGTYPQDTTNGDRTNADTANADTANADTTDADTTTPKSGSRPTLLPIGVLHNLYILCQSETGLVVIDQHAAHERLLFEKLRRQYLGGSIPRQNLLFPESVELSPFQCRLVEEHREELARMGFSCREFGGNTYLIAAVPALAGRIAPGEIFLDLLERFGSERERPGEDRIDGILAQMACKAAVKGGTSLDQREIEQLLEQMAAADLFSHCPHGRPVVRQFSLEEVQRWFHRS